MVVVGADGADGNGVVFIDKDLLLNIPNHPENYGPSAGPSYGDSSSAFFDSVPHAIVSALLFILLPVLAVGSLFHNRKRLYDLLSLEQWRFQPLHQPLVANIDAEKAALPGNKRIFVHDPINILSSEVSRDHVDERSSFIRV